MNFYKELVNISLKKNISLCDMTDEFFCLTLNNIFLNNDKSIILVVDSLYEANILFNKISNYNDNAYLFPMDDFLTSEALVISPDLRIKRLDTLNNLISNKKSIVITNLMGYLRFLPNVSTYINSCLSLNVDDVINPKDLVNKLMGLGYKRDTIVNQTGEFALRGFIVDIFPFDEELPIRIEFFDDVIESIRYFDIDSQRSIDSVTNLTIKPFFEFITVSSVKEEHFGKQKYYPLYENVSNISDYLGDCYTIFKDYSMLLTSYGNIEKEIIEYNSARDNLFTGKYMFTFDSISTNYPIFYNSLNNIDTSLDNSLLLSFDVKSINNFNEDIDSINKFVNKNITCGKTIIIALKDYQLNNIRKHLKFKYIDTSLDSIVIGQVNLVEQEFTEGFAYKDIILLTAKELFIFSESNKSYNNNFKYSSSIRDINKLMIGDYVVHNIHGIGIYNGIKSLSFNKITKDYIEVLYQGTDKIYIPVEKIELLHKYSGREGVSPKINKLGGTEWKKVKNRVKNKVKDIANQLIRLYAERESRKGYAFSPDCELSIEFERAFPYTLTVDQKKSIQQIKEDMESTSPMDRLLCGDVGFGKTEVAFVAAFKAILDSKQVMFLCPTTILSNQHYENALKRFEQFPVTIELLNRFTTKKDVVRILNGLKNGTVDMIIGTHRLLSNDIHLKDLGLLIIDEEQRFGVTHKEKIKHYKTNIDVLTLTATPIPRTLQMSLTGIRSLSLIETPPTNRYPVQTYVLEENKQIIKDAISKELARNGQVYILYNRVQSIEEYAFRIHNIVPEARIGIAHGQMSKNELESTIYSFLNYKYDILLCTTIIETGIDIPNVNTLIIIDADRFGLSQLYQIRGRVGRSDRFAYAYLMYQPFKTLTDTAVKRLNVIKEFTELGSGFSIATRDLSIRGAGDILGSEQAGFIDSVGIDLYLKLLEEEIQKKNNTELDEVDEKENKPLIDVATHIEDDYVYEDDLKIEVHRMINSIDSKERLENVKMELEDRFGKVSEDLVIYMYEEWFERLAKSLNISNVVQTKNSIEMIFSSDVVSKMDTEDVFVYAFEITNMFRFISRGSNLVIVLDIIKLDKHPIYYLTELLDKIRQNLQNSID